MIEVGESVAFVDPTGRTHEALVTTVFAAGHPGTDDNYPAINLVYVSDDPSETDQYGRQIKRYTSVVHETKQAAHGMFWRELE